ncbi:hypothetical protein QT381_15525 [Galbitalea sp. SE-J8]|uniref:hypothetical protein n=1 Tax=Galbitalea sp. SE-J8 TaxID=3054952 RepID=UPI00259C70DD|nr:hypothetical protein [Galbitalea sp. SE-J8]MDM4764410.1 hypothetical protein [Galbitalea sp. SE-J8]
MMKKAAFRTAGLFALLLSVAGCAGPVGSAGQQAPATAGPTRTANSEDPFASYSESIDCTALIAPERLKALQEKGWQQYGADYVRSAGATYDPSSDGPSPLRIVLYGGNMCAWGSGDEEAILYGYGPLPADVAGRERQLLIDTGSKPLEGALEAYTNPYGYDGGWAFGSEQWAYALVTNPEDDGAALLDELIARIPKF